MRRPSFPAATRCGRGQARRVSRPAPTILRACPSASAPDRPIRLRLRVVPGARRSQVVGRLGESWKLRVHAAPERGRANDEVVALLAETLGLRAVGDPRRRGPDDARQGRRAVAAISLDEAEQRLAAAAEGAPDERRPRPAPHGAARPAHAGARRGARHRLRTTTTTASSRARRATSTCADHASDMLDREVDESLEDNAEQIVHEIDVALGRIEEGTYGTCAPLRAGDSRGAARRRAVRDPLRSTASGSRSAGERAGTRRHRSARRGHRWRSGSARRRTRSSRFPARSARSPPAPAQWVGARRHRRSRPRRPTS